MGKEGDWEKGRTPPIRTLFRFFLRSLSDAKLPLANTFSSETANNGRGRRRISKSSQRFQFRQCEVIYVKSRARSGHKYIHADRQTYFMQITTKH